MNDEMIKTMKRMFKSEESLGGPMDDKDLDKMITEFEENKRRFKEELNK